MSLPVSFAFHRTDEILEALRLQALHVRRGTRRHPHGSRRHRGHGRLGDDGWGDWIANKIESGYRRGAELTQVAVQATVDGLSAPIVAVYGKLKAGGTELLQTARDVAASGYELEGQALDELGKRALAFADGLATGGAGFLQKVGTGAGEAFKGFWGVPPAAMILVGLVVLGGGGYLLLSPGGQALLRGGGGAIGMGGGELLGGAGKLLGGAGKLLVL